MQEEILSLKLRVSEQEEVLKGTIQRLRSTSRTKESMEHFIVNQCKNLWNDKEQGKRDFVSFIDHIFLIFLQHELLLKEF